jgi:paraquat-inducible protein B
VRSSPAPAAPEARFAGQAGTRDGSPRGSARRRAAARRPGRPLAVACAVLGLACGARAEGAAGPLLLAQAADPRGVAGRALQGAGELLDRGKAAVGLGREDPEGRTATGVGGGVPFLVRFRGTVGGLEPGDPVEVRGMRMGAVREVRVTFDPAAEDFDIPVVIELDPRPFVGGEPGADAPARVEAAVAALVRHGLRARVGTRNLAAGQRLVRLDTAPDEGPGELGRGEGPPEIPAVSAATASPAAVVDDLLARLSEAPLNQAVGDAAALVAAARRLAEDPGLREAGPRLAVLAERAGDVTAEVDGLLAGSRRLPAATGELLHQLTETSRSLRALADDLEREPQALLRGKAGGS